MNGKYISILKEDIISINIINQRDYSSGGTNSNELKPLRISKPFHLLFEVHKPFINISFKGLFCLSWNCWRFINSLVLSTILLKLPALFNIIYLIYLWFWDILNFCKDSMNHIFAKKPMWSIHTSVSPYYLLWPNLISSCVGRGNINLVKLTAKNTQKRKLVFSPQKGVTPWLQPFSTYPWNTPTAIVYKYWVIFES